MLHFLLLLLSVAAFAQNEVSYKRGATQLEDILPPSPEAVSRVKYADVPFTHSMGAAEYSVPIYELKGRRLTIPISLDYCSNGIRMDEIAGVAGLGWTLNARMTTDAEAGLTIAYNVLDLPERISLGTTLKVKYTYLADGTKVSALDASGAGLVYRGPFTYRKGSGGTLTFESAPFDRGRLTEAGTRYHVTDHLGSVRAVINGNASTTTYPLTGFYSVDDFAPFGTKSTSSASTYLSLASTGTTVSLRDGFTGQEDQTPDFSVGYSDFGARQYSPSLSRWLVPDPMGEKYYDVSPYAYCAGNPIVFIDDGGTDIVLAGINSSSVTVVTDLIDIHVNLTRLGVDWGGEYHLQGDRLLSTALDIAGLFDQSGTSDVINAKLQFNSGEIFAGTVSLISATPAIGDIAKLTRLGRNIRVLNDAISVVDSGAKWTKSLRSNMVRELEKIGKAAPERMHAHHVLPRIFLDIFDNAGIDINNPKYGVWLEPRHHLFNAWKYNKEWDNFFKLNQNPTIKEIEEEAKLLMKTVYEYEY